MHTGEIMQTLIPTTTKDWKSDDCALNILEGLSILICEEPDYHKQLQYLETLLQKIISPLMENILWIELQEKSKGRQLAETDISDYVSSQISIYLELIGELCKDFKLYQQEQLAEEQNAFKPIFEQIWVFIHGLLEKYSHLEKLAEASTRVLKHCMRILPELFKQNCLLEFLKIVISKFDTSPFACYIYSVEFCIKEYAA